MEGLAGFGPRLGERRGFVVTGSGCGGSLRKFSNSASSFEIRSSFVSSAEGATKGISRTTFCTSEAKSGDPIGGDGAAATGRAVSPLPVVELRTSKNLSTGPP